MKIVELIKKNFLGAAAVAIAIGTMSFTLIEKVKTPSKATTVTVFFNGDPTNATQVADEARWSEDNPSLTCPNGNQKACSMDVQDTDLNPSTGALDPAKISLNANATSSGYIPSKAGGSGSTPVIHNRN
ncbi:MULTISPECIES: hypothetical protein [Sphingobacterium]|uniref:hypothetical protein n=1 Tax=Sphingobacterium TaxID=28453 RepID=UPI0025803C97|nr:MULTISPECIES: hypothetical protein [Sphingobacterium]